MTRAQKALAVACARYVLAATLSAFSLGAQEQRDTARMTLKEHVRAASPAIAARRAALNVAVARHAAAGLRSPSVLSAEIEEVPGLNVAQAQSVRLDVAQELLPRGRRTAERTLAELDIQRARIELEMSLRALDLSVDQLITQAAGGAVIANRLASQDSLLRGAEEALRARFAVADARFVDVLRLRTERLRIDTELHRARSDSRIALRQLLRLAGPTDSSSIVDVASRAVAEEAARLRSGTPAPLPSIDSLLGASVAKRLAANAVQRAEASRHLVAAELRPNLRPSIGLQRFDDATRGRSIGLTAGISVGMPFTARSANRARHDVVEQELMFARALQAATESALHASLTLASDRYETARAQIASFDAALLRGAREEREAALAAYRNGTMSLVELLDFERALAQAEVSRIRSQIEAAEAFFRYLTTALGLPDVGGVR